MSLNDWNNINSSLLDDELIDRLPIHHTSSSAMLILIGLTICSIIFAVFTAINLHTIKSELRNLELKNADLQRVIEDKDRAIFSLKQAADKIKQNHQSKNLTVQLSPCYLQKPGVSGNKKHSSDGWVAQIGSIRALDSESQSKKTLKECLGDKPSIDSAVVQCVRQKK